MISVLFVCHGNICRSPMAEFLLRHTLENLGKSDEFFVASAATSIEETGSGVHPGAKRKLAELGISADSKRAVKLTKSDYDKYDYIIGMDEWNIKNILRITGGDAKNKVFKLLDFTDTPHDIADPWYSGDFDEAYNDIINGIIGFLKNLQDKKLAVLWSE